MPSVISLENFPVLETVISLPPPMEAVYFAGRRGRVLLSVRLIFLPVPLSIFRLEYVWGRGVVQLIIGPPVGLIGRCEGPLVVGGPPL